jgi:hypothetical protein
LVAGGWKRKRKRERDAKSDRTETRRASRVEGGERKVSLSLSFPRVAIT